MRAVLYAFALVFFGAFGSASAQSNLTVKHEKNVPTVNSGLYLVRVECHPYRLDPSNSNNRFYPPWLAEESRQLLFTITLSNARIGTNLLPPTSSILTAIPVVVYTLSTQAPVQNKNNACNQSLLLTGRTPLYLTAAYSDQISRKPSELVEAIAAFAGLAAQAPLVGFFPKGVANVLKADATAASSMEQPYGKLLGALSYASSQTNTLPLEEGPYVVSTPVGYVTIKVEKLSSLESALQIGEIARALDTSWESLGSQVHDNIAKDPRVCFVTGKTLELNQNLSHSDAVHALAKIVNYSAITSSQATSCLGSYFGREVAVDLKTLNPNLHLGPEYPDLESMVSFIEVQQDFARMAAAMAGYAAGQNTKDKAELDNLFEPQVSITDTAPQIFPEKVNLSIEQILDKMKVAPKQYVFYGCQDKDNTLLNGVPDTGFVLAIGKDKNPVDVLIMRTWWRVPEKGGRPRVYQTWLGYDAAVSQALNTYKNECAYQVVVRVPGAAPPAPEARGSASAIPTPAFLALSPVLTADEP